MGVSLGFRVGPLRFSAHSRRGDTAGIVAGFCSLVAIAGKLVLELRRVSREAIKNPASTKNERIVGHLVFWPCQLIIWAVVAYIVVAITVVTYGVGTIVAAVVIALMWRHYASVAKAQAAVPVEPLEAEPASLPAPSDPALPAPAQLVASSVDRWQDVDFFTSN